MPASLAEMWEVVERKGAREPGRRVWLESLGVALGADMSLGLKRQDCCLAISGVNALF
jgi:hypothetical protein